MKKIIGAFLIALSLVATGCLHEEEDIFGKSAATVQKNLRKVRKLLWLLLPMDG